MADHTHIEWTDATWNPITGCSIVSPGCTNCYAMKLAGTRLKHHPSRAGLTDMSKAGPVWNGQVRLNEEWLDQPLRWKRPRRIFVCAHGDLFAENVPDEWIDRVFAVMALAPTHTFQVLTKRAKRMREYIAGLTADQDLGLNRLGITALWTGRCPPGQRLPLIPIPNVWLGVSAERQQEADERVPELLATPAAIRFVSAEPMLGPIDFTTISTGHYFINALKGQKYHDAPQGAVERCAKLDQIIGGGESGPKARPMHPAWPRSILRQCTEEDTAFFFKQWGSNAVVYDRQRDDPDWRRCDIVARQTPRGRWLNLAGGHGFHGEKVVRVDHVGKKRAGRLLDGVEHNGFPEVAQ